MPDRPLQLLLAIHNHQPDGNFGHVFQQAYDDCYGPLVDALYEAPHMRVALHHTGALFEWIERERPQYFDKLRALVGRKQVELLGGGFYEPMLAVLPERDARGQIELMNDYIQTHFGARPEGMWLAERVWEPALAKLIADAGMKFTLVDDGHFRAAGLDGLLRGYYVTEKAGTPLAIFPIDKSLRDAIPFLKAWETLDVLERLRAETPAELDATVTYGDDGEKFGVWPKTKEWVWGQGWLREFHRLLGERRDKVNTVHFGEYLATHPPTGRVYLPTASYEEMGEWALPAQAQHTYLSVRQALADRDELDRARPFVRGGIWQGFLAKYPEANFMHKKMVLVSDKLERAQLKLGAGANALDHARRELYRAQCNCCYWHGLFGGLYLNYLRDTVYHHLIDAELAADRVLGEPERGVVVRDLDADLRPEIAAWTPELQVYVKPDRGGSVFELDYRPKRFNLLNVLGRREEGYHGKLLAATQHKSGSDDGPVSIHDLVAVKSAGLEDLLVYDRFPRGAFIDHFLTDKVTLAEMQSGRHEEVGDFAAGAYELVSAQPKKIVLARRGSVWGHDVTIEKTLTLEGAELAARYKLSTRGGSLDLVFAPEVDLTLLAGDAPDRYYRVPGQELADRRLASCGELPQGAPLELVNEWDRFYVRVTASPEVALWRYPLETASQSEGGFERTYQSSVILPRFRASLAEGRDFEAVVTIAVKPL
ncbi:MAG TPA: alpha-amylase/4-alpha-glucanotransferase domain-containing protein [Polyangia bacterium]|nr:alpha-amylase/4-alpha-glucanotransferase domain-containing protein [Polyangia bacterium]